MWWGRAVAAETKTTCVRRPSVLAVRVVNANRSQGKGRTIIARSLRTHRKHVRGGGNCARTVKNGCDALKKPTDTLDGHTAVGAAANVGRVLGETYGRTICRALERNCETTVAVDPVWRNAGRSYGLRRLPDAHARARVAPVISGPYARDSRSPW